MRRFIPTVVAACALILGAAPVLAGGPAETHTETVKNFAESFPDGKSVYRRSRTDDRHAHGLILLTPAAERLGRASGPLMIL